MQSVEGERVLLQMDTCCVPHLPRVGPRRQVSASLPQPRSLRSLPRSLYSGPSGRTRSPTASHCRFACCMRVCMRVYIHACMHACAYTWQQHDMTHSVALLHTGTHHTRHTTHHTTHHTRHTMPAERMRGDTYGWHASTHLHTQTERQTGMAHGGGPRQQRRDATQGRRCASGSGQQPAARLLRPVPRPVQRAVVWLRLRGWSLS